MLMCELEKVLPDCAFHIVEKAVLRLLCRYVSVVPLSTMTPYIDKQEDGWPRVGKRRGGGESIERRSEKERKG